MPDFDDNENMIETGDTALTYEFRGDGQVWRFTSSDVPLTRPDGAEYECVPITMGNVVADAAMGGGEIDVTMARSVTLADRFFPVADPVVFTVRIAQASHSEGVIQDDPLVFHGVVIAGAITEDGTRLRLKCATQMSRLERNGLRRRYQHHCPFVLYGSQCRASVEISKFPATISVSGDLATIWFYGPDADQPRIWRGRDLGKPENREFMHGATVRFGGSEFDTLNALPMTGSPNRFVLRVSPRHAAALLAAVSAVPPEERTCEIIPNCDRTLNSCSQVHSNAPNFGGFPFIPFKNPIHTSLIG